MAVTSGFFNSLYGDRKYTAEQFSALFNGLINDGVFSNIGTAFRVSATTDNVISIGIGRAWFNGIWVNNDALLPMTCNDPEVLLDRIDAVVIEINRSEAVRAGRIIFVKGAASGTPVNPTMTHDESVDQYPLAYIRRKAGVSEVVQADITNCIGTSECPYVTGILETQNIDSIVAQWESQFNLWFDGLQTELEGDVAANLASQIISLDMRFDELAKTRTVTVELEDSSLDTIEDSTGAAIYGSTVLESEGSGTIVVEQGGEDPNIGRIKINDEYEDVMKTVPVGFMIGKVGSGTIVNYDAPYSMQRNGERITCGNWMIFLNASFGSSNYPNRSYYHLFAFNFKTNELRNIESKQGTDDDTSPYQQRGATMLTYLGPNKFAYYRYWNNGGTTQGQTGWLVYDVTDSNIVQNQSESILKSKYTSSSLNTNLFMDDQIPKLVTIKDEKAYFVRTGYVHNTLERFVFTYSGSGSISKTNEIVAGYSLSGYYVMDSENILARYIESYNDNYTYTKYNIVTNTKTTLPNIDISNVYQVVAILEKHIVFTSGSYSTVYFYNLETDTIKNITLTIDLYPTSYRAPVAIKNNKLYFCGYQNYVPIMIAIDLDTLTIVSKTDLRIVGKESSISLRGDNVLEIREEANGFVTWPRPEFREPNAAFSWSGEILKDSSRLVINEITYTSYSSSDARPHYAFILDIDEQIIFDDWILTPFSDRIYTFVNNDTLLFLGYAERYTSGYQRNIEGVVRKLLPLYTTKTDLGGEEDEV